MRVWTARLAAVAAAVGAAASPGMDEAHAAGAAYQVDTAEISEPGNCKVETWASFARNGDRFAAASPACSVPFTRPLELSAQFNASKSEGEWDAAVTPKIKMNILESAILKPGIAVSGTFTYDFVTREVSTVNFTVPVTLRLSNVVRININGGWMLDRTVERQYMTYGIGVDWRTPDNVWTLTAEVFGQLGNLPDDVNRTVGQPRWQVGLRWRPIDEYNVDLIYGRNIAGENSNWITLATVVRFKVGH
jgi:hypothetical protein